MFMVTAVLYVDPAFSFAFLDRNLDITVNSLIVVAGLSLAALALARYRESGRVSGLFQSSAFLVMMWVTFVNVAVVLRGIDGFDLELTLARAEQSQLPFYVWGLSRLLAAVLLVVGGIAAVGPAPGPAHQAHPAATAGRPVGTDGPALPHSRPAAAIRWAGGHSADGRGATADGARAVPDMTPLAIIFQSTLTGPFRGRRAALPRSYLRGGPVLDGYLAVALVLAAFAEIHFLIFPGLYTNLVTTTDAIRLAFFGVLLLGISSESRSDLRALRSAYALSIGCANLRPSERARGAHASGT
jgi:hypothetical protein